MRAFIHDVVNPLAAIRISTGALRARTPLPDGELSHIRQIEEASEAIIRLVTTLEPLRDARGRLPVATTVTPAVDLYVLCCELAALRRMAGGTIIQCRAFGDPRGDWDRDEVARLVWSLLDHASSQLGKDAQMTVAVTGMARHVRLDIHGLGWSGAHRRDTALGALPRIRGVPAGASIDTIASRNGGIILRLRLPRRNPPPPQSGREIARSSKGA